MKTLAQYTNGNYTVKLLTDGTKIRYTEADAFIPDFPESIDVKITNFCDNNCSYCHEMSTIKGKHADLTKLLDVIKDLPAGVELAIGGGNPLSHPDLVGFLIELKSRGIVANMTVNQNHLNTPLKFFQIQLIMSLIMNDLIKGLGISIINDDFSDIIELKKLSNNIVYHLIVGINTPAQLDKLIALGNCKVLLLGYKQFGFGKKYYSDIVAKNIVNWNCALSSYIRKCVISFDNLAIEQLNVKRLFTAEGWNKFYMGDDFMFTMYIDAVNQMFAPTSRSVDRVSFNDSTLLEYFKSDQNI